MRDQRINFRSPELAALLAFLIPGAGHFYQKRNFKAAIFCGGILCLFFGGMVLGNWQPVYSQVVYAESQNVSVQMQSARSRTGSHFSIGYAPQAFVGLVAMPAMIQQYRFSADEGFVNRLDHTVDSEFQGGFKVANGFIPVSGHLHLEPTASGGGEGIFEGTTRDGTAVSVTVTGDVDLGREVFGSPNRDVQVEGLSNVEIDGVPAYSLLGTVSRPFLNWYQAPRDNAELDRLHNKLSQNYDIACLFTWIAGLLNLMAIWDAYDGPAYGYGDEKPEDEESPEDG